MSGKPYRERAVQVSGDDDGTVTTTSTGAATGGRVWKTVDAATWQHRVQRRNAESRRSVGRSVHATRQADLGEEKAWTLYDSRGKPGRRSATAAGANIGHVGVGT